MEESQIEAGRIDVKDILPKMTEKQLECLSIIASFYKENRYYPSRRQIAQKMGITAGAAGGHILLLQKKGYLELETGERRNIRLTQKALERLNS